VQEQVRRAGGAAVAIGVRERARDGDRAAAVIAEAPCDPPRLSNAVCGEEREIWRRGRVDPNVSRATRIEALWNVHDRDVHTFSLQATGGISAAGVDDDELDFFFLLEERANRRDQRRFIAVAEDRASKLCLHREDPKSRATGLSPVQRRSPNDGACSRSPGHHGRSAGRGRRAGGRCHRWRRRRRRRADGVRRRPHERR